MQNEREPPAVFETERLLLRPWTTGEADVEAAFAIYRDPEVACFIRPTGPEESLETQRATLERAVTRYQELGIPYGFWALTEKATGNVVGSAMLKPLPGWSEVEIGWHLHRAHWGKGFATEAGRACLERGLYALDVPRLVAVVHPDNHASRAVALRIGMRPEGTIRAYDMELNFFVFDRAAPVENRRGTSP